MATRRSRCKALEHYDFSDVDICLMSAGSAVSKEWSPKIAAAGAVVIDNSSCWRYDADVPLIVPEVNADAVAGFRKKGIIANPNCSTAQLVVALKPLHDKAKIKRVVVATYQSVSGAGKEAMDELFAQTKSVFTLGRDREQEVPQAHRLQRDPAHRRVHGRRLHQGRMEDGGRDQEDPRPQDQAGRHLRARAGLRRPFGSREHRVREPDHRGRGARDPAQRAGLPRHRQARGRRLRHALRGGGRGRDLYQPHPRGPDGRERPRAVVRLRQPAQGRGAQRHPDRGVPDQPQADQAKRKAA